MKARVSFASLLLLLTLACGGGGGGSTPGAPAGSVVVAISTAAPALYPNGTCQFAAQVTGAANTAVTWVTSVGTIDANGRFTAPLAITSGTVTAISVADPTRSASVPVSVVAPTGQQTLAGAWKGQMRDLTSPGVVMMDVRAFALDSGEFRLAAKPAGLNGRWMELDATLALSGSALAGTLTQRSDSLDLLTFSGTAVTGQAIFGIFKNVQGYSGQISLTFDPSVTTPTATALAGDWLWSGVTTNESGSLTLDSRLAVTGAYGLSIPYMSVLAGSASLTSMPAGLLRMQFSDTHSNYFGVTGVDHFNGLAAYYTLNGETHLYVIASDPSSTAHFVQDLVAVPKVLDSPAPIGGTTGTWNGSIHSNAAGQTITVRALGAPDGRIVYFGANGVQVAGVTSVTGASFTGTGTITAPFLLPAGVYRATASVGGTISATSTSANLSGTYAGGGDTGTFSLSFDAKSNRPASLATPAGRWVSTASITGRTITVTATSDGSLTGSDSQGTLTGSFTVVNPAQNLYALTLTYTGYPGGASEGVWTYTGLGTLDDTTVRNDTFQVSCWGPSGQFTASFLRQ